MRHSGRVQCPILLAAAGRSHFFVKADARFVAEPLALQQRLQQTTSGAVSAPAGCIARQRARNVAAHHHRHINAHQIHQPENCRARIAHQRAADRVRFFHAVAVVQRIAHAKAVGSAANAVADKVGRVFAQHHALAQALCAKRLQKLHERRARVGSRDHLQQLKVAWRVEEMGAAKVAAEIRRAAARQLLNGQAGGVAGHQLSRRAHLLQPLIKAAFRRQILNDDLNHPIHLRKACKVILQVANGEQCCCCGCEKRCRSGGFNGGEPVVDDAVAHSRR